MPLLTKRLYFEDAYRTEFAARVLAAREYNHRPAVILDETCFYPEGGGQPSDRGTLSGQKIFKVVEQGGEILHVLEKGPPEGEVQGEIDWGVRFDHMQQHSGQHVLSQCFAKLFSGRTESFHLGEQVSTLEISLDSLSQENLDRVEHCANLVVFQNREIKTYFVEPGDLARVPLRKPPKKKGSIRVVEVGGFDYTACGGTHPRWTGEIGLIKLLRSERIRNHMRFEFVCGGRALRDYRFRDHILAETAAKFSAGEAELPALVDKLKSEHKELTRSVKKLSDRLILQEAEDLIRSEKESVSLKVFHNRPLPEVRRLALAVIRHPGRVLLWGLPAGPRVHVVLARSHDVDVDLRELMPILSPLLNGKGGGRPSLVEMAGDKPDSLEAALQTARHTIKL